MFRNDRTWFYLFKTLAASKDFEGKERRIIAYDSINMNSPYDVNDRVFIENQP